MSEIGYVSSTTEPQGEKRFSTQHSGGGEPNAVRFCGRCQSWLPNTVETHVCKKAPRVRGYAWYEHDEPAIEKNSIIQESSPARPGKLLEVRRAEQLLADKRSHIAIEE